MIALSIKEKYINFISCYKDGVDFFVDDFGSFRKRDDSFNNILNSILIRKKISKSNMKSKKVMAFLDLDKVIFNQFKAIPQLENENLLSLHKTSMFGKNAISKFKDYHYQGCSDNKIISVYIDENIRREYYEGCYNIGLNLKVLSMGLFSAEYLAREVFDAKSCAKYMIWSVGDVFDEVMIIEDGLLKNVFQLLRLDKSFKIINLFGDSKYAFECADSIKKNFEKSLSSIDFIDKIYMYQKSSHCDMKKIIKKNKDKVIILNPLSKMNLPKKAKFDEISSSYLSEMGYIFKQQATND
ncbi:MAG: hypothetical protein CMG00_04490 [Candidatus Marinimicrobia bacterium]|nr:hypothetical protein [Candidatus Neomarinimicrobiota bacterium]|tara:strand:- start:1339 stop:2229 length:891 start_codon:yes stop_codon:yes gene_type:complete